MGGALCIEGAVRLPLDSGAGGVAGITGCLAMVQVITNIMYFGWIVDMNVYNQEKSTLSQGTTSFRGEPHWGNYSADAAKCILSSHPNQSWKRSSFKIYDAKPVGCYCFEPAMMRMPNG